MQLEQNPCQALCRWLPDARSADPNRLRCEGCGSQWDPSQGWLPLDQDGSVPVAARLD